MTRRFVISILLTVWTIFIVGGVFAWFSVKSILIADLDASLFARAAALPELLRPTGPRVDIPQYDWSDHYTIQHDSSRSAIAVEGNLTKPEAPRLIMAYDSTTTDGQKKRRVVVSGWTRSKNGAIEPVTVTYNGSMEHVEHVLNRLAWALGAFVAIGGLLTAAVAGIVSRFCFRPLSKTVDALQAVNEHRLNTRLSTTQLPRELTPVATRLNDLLARLEGAFTQRKQFLADASHELRTPVAALVTMLEIARQQPQDAASYQRTIDQLLGDAQLLRKLVERLMEHASSERATNETPEETNVTELLYSCADMAERLGAEKGSRIIRTIPRDLRCMIHSDRLRSVIINLLSNAVEYDHPGGTIQLTAIHDGQQLRISVCDQGMGIPPEHVLRVFDPFYRVDKFSGQEHLGLGLFIVRAHVQSMGGDVRVESRLGVGTTFYVDLPCVGVSEQGVASHTDPLMAVP